MKIPDGPSGFPTLSATQFRTYGAGGFVLDSQEQTRGCPRLYKARYIEHRPDADRKGDALRYGSFVHDVLFRMEEDGLTPDEALAAAFDPTMPPEFWTEARADLDAYLARGASPMDRFATLQVEAELDALLYVDEEFGPIHFRGFLDWIGLDPDMPNLIHGVDYKSNRTPPKVADLLGDVQLRGYHWLIEQNASRWTEGPVRVVMHLDAIKYRDVEIAYTPEEIEDWHSWAVAVARKILRDEEANPVINDGCAWCPIRYDCPAFEALPDDAALMARRPTFADPKDRLAWRDRANSMRLLLEKAVKAVDDEFKADATRQGRITVGDEEFVLEPDFRTVIDMRALHRALGSDLFYGIVTTSKTKIESVTKGMDSGALAAVLRCIERVPDGQKVVRRKAES